MWIGLLEISVSTRARKPFRTLRAGTPKRALSNYAIGMQGRCPGNYDGDTDLW
jgi:hypothetical protein